MLHFADSLDKPLSDDGGDGESQTVGNMVADPNDVIAEVEDKIYRRELHDVLQERLNYCTEEQQRILKMRYTYEMTSAEIAKMMDVRTEYVNSEIAKAFRTLRAPLAYACLKKFTG